MRPVIFNGCCVPAVLTCRWSALLLLIVMPLIHWPDVVRIRCDEVFWCVRRGVWCRLFVVPPMRRSGRFRDEC